MRLFDADAIWQEIQDDIEEGGMSGVVGGALRRYLRRQPTVDAVPVVRCKDCKFWFRNNGHDKNGCPITDSDIWMDDSGFCSYGERKDNENN